MAGCVTAAALTGGFLLLRRWRAGPGPDLAGVADDRRTRDNWRMPPLAMLAPVRMSVGRRVAMSAMWVYIGAAMALVIARVVQIALG